MGERFGRCVQRGWFFFPHLGGCAVVAIPALSAGVEVASPLLTLAKQRERVGVPLAKDPTSQEGLWVLNRTSIERESKQAL